MTDKIQNAYDTFIVSNENRYNTAPRKTFECGYKAGQSDSDNEKLDICNQALLRAAGIKNPKPEYEDSKDFNRNVEDCDLTPPEDILGKRIKEAVTMLQELIDGGEEVRGMDSAISAIIRKLEGHPYDQ